MKKLFTLFALFNCLIGVFGQAGKPDPRFGTNGIVKADLGSVKINTDVFYSTPLGAFVLPDGRINAVLSVYNQAQKIYITRRLQDGTTDTSFGTKGYSGPYDVPATGAIPGPNGTVVIFGQTNNSSFVIARFDSYGKPDSTFGDSGIQSITVLHPQVIAAQNDGKILVAFVDRNAGGTDFKIGRYNVDGSVDVMFGNNGFQVTDLGSDNEEPSAIVIQSDGKIVLGGTSLTSGINGSYSNFALARYNSDGSPDNTFGAGGKVFTASPLAESWDLRSLLIQPDGKIVAGGRNSLCDNKGCFDQTALVRYNSDGSLDNTFNGTGKQSVSFGRPSGCVAIALQPDGKIITSGWYGALQHLACVARFNTDGALDSTFGKDGFATTQIAQQVLSNVVNTQAIQSDGKILLAVDQHFPNSASFVLCRYNINGNLDTTFGRNGILSDSVTNVYPSSYTAFDRAGIQTDGKILAWGITKDTISDDRLVIARYNADGTADTIAYPVGVIPTTLGIIPETNTAQALLPDGKILRVNGLGFQRFNPDGTLDITSQSAAGGANAAGSALGVGVNNKIVVAGNVYQTNYIRGYPVDQQAWVIARFNSDGAVDSIFGNSGILLGSYVDVNSGQVPTAVALQSDGSVIMSFNNITPNYDPGQQPPEFIDVALVRFDSSGKTSTSLGFWQYAQDGGPIFIQNDDKILFKLGGGILRYNADGSFDSTFHTIPGLLFAMQTDGKMIGYNSPSVSRYDKNGIPDSSFGTNGKIPVNYSINDMQVRNNKLVTAGSVRNGFLVSGIVGLYLLDNASPFSCPSYVTVSNQKEKCSAMVSNIDPILTDATLPVNYTLTGATILNGSRSASGLTFNGGVTTVTYALATDPNATCSFDVTVKDTEPPRMTKVFALPNVLWPVNQKMRKVLLAYLTRDNCGAASCKISVTGNQDVSGDWSMISEHIVSLRATSDQGRERIYTVTVTCTDEAGNATSRNVKVYIPGQRANPGIESESAPPFDYAGIFSVDAYPNPSTDYFRLHITSPDRAQKVAVKVYDVSGRLMEVKNGVAAGEDIRVGAALGAGIYFVRIQQGKNSGYIKLVKTTAR